MNTSPSELYRHSSDAVRARFTAEKDAAAFYERYVEFVTGAAPVEAYPTVLDVGCGTGWSSFFLSQRGYRVTGVDLNPADFEPPVAPGLELREGSALELPFDSGAFDVVTTYQMLEHIPEPRRALDELVRVCRPGGVICVAGPNLLSPLHSVRNLTRFLWQTRPLWQIFRRVEGMPYHPFGNTLWEALFYAARNPVLLARKAWGGEISFTLREPDQRPPFHGDNDACYLMNPLDLCRYFTGAGCRVLRVAPYSRPEWTMLFAGGTWVATQTPGGKRR